MAKASTQFVCQACGATSLKWLGRCVGCGGWNTLVEERVAASGGATRRAPDASDRRAVTLDAIPADTAARVSTGMSELDRVLGGGAVLGAVCLVGGDPGVGKSTLLLQALAGLQARGVQGLYISGEESAGQTAQRARRLGLESDKLLILAESDLAEIERALKETRPKALVVDSVQTIRSDSLESAAGTVSQLREVTARLTDLSKREGIATFLVGHVTKEGQLAGPKVLEHLVDTVLSFEGERGHAFRALRTTKNRFGAATEVGVFEMTADGMREVLQPSALFLAERPAGASGSVVAATAEGARPVLVEVQALVGAPGFASPRRRRRGSTVAGWPCCWRFYRDAQGSRSARAMCSSISRVGCESRSPRRTWRLRCRLPRRFAIVPSMPTRWHLAKWVSLVRSEAYRERPCGSPKRVRCASRAW